MQAQQLIGKEKELRIMQNAKGNHNLTHYTYAK